jgi:hypothetical protein
MERLSGDHGMDAQQLIQSTTTPPDTLAILHGTHTPQYPANTASPQAPQILAVRLAPLNAKNEVLKET